MGQKEQHETPAALQSSVQTTSVAPSEKKIKLNPLLVAKPFSTNDLISQLKESGLWDLTDKTEINPLLLPGFPVNLHHLDVPRKKRAFFHTLLPVAKIALLEVEEEREKLLSLLDKLPVSSDQLISENVINLMNLSNVEQEFLTGLMEKYRANNFDELLSRVDVFPVSLILAQGAIESSWGSSRFATEGNNLFGIWTWGEKGMIPAERQEGKNHKVAIYDSILDSVRAYLLTLNRIEAHRAIREIRLQTTDSLQLAEGLINYSERREEYISDVKMIIDYNRLQEYDVLRLAESEGVLGTSS